MKVYDFLCSQHHGFEGWFSDEEDYLRQTRDGLMQCPVCGDMQIERKPSAPRLKKSAPSDETVRARSELTQAIEAHLRQQVKAWVDQTVDVGRDFPEQARKIHYGEAPERAIRGQATQEEARELVDEGIEILAIPIPLPGKDQLQ